MTLSENIISTTDEADQVKALAKALDDAMEVVISLSKQAPREPITLVVGEGGLMFNTIHGEGKHGIFISPSGQRRKINERFTEGETLYSINNRHPDSVAIWAANLEGVRVFQDTLNALALFMNGCVVEDAE